jgi:hypothetical protein
MSENNERLTNGKVGSLLISSLQQRILAALPLATDKPISAGEIMRRIGIVEPTPSNRASISRSLARLCSRGLICRWRARVYLQGNGSRWTRPLPEAAQAARATPAAASAPAETDKAVSAAPMASDAAPGDDPIPDFLRRDPIQLEPHADEVNEAA